jgi:hypothetical protein
MLFLSKGHNKVGLSPLHLMAETNAVSKTLCSLVFLECRTIIIIIMVLQPFVGPSPRFQFFDPVHNG